MALSRVTGAAALARAARRPLGGGASRKARAGEDEAKRRGLFAKHGTVEKVWIARSPPGFAFVWLTDERDVADAIKALDGAELGRHKATVAVASGLSKKVGGWPAAHWAQRRCRWARAWYPRQNRQCTQIGKTPS